MARPFGVGGCGACELDGCLESQKLKKCTIETGLEITAQAWASFSGATLLQYGNTHENFGGFGALPVAPVSEAEGRVTDLWVGAQLPKHAHHPTHTPFEQLAVHYDASASAFCMLFKLTVRRWHSLRFRWVPDCQCPECSNRRRGHCKTLAVPVLGTYEN